MADYYSPTVITSPVRLTDALAFVLEAQGGSCSPTGEEETVLDGLANERAPLRKYYVTFEEGWQDGQGAEELLDWRDLTEEDAKKEHGDGIIELLDSESHILMREILKLNPELQQIEAQCGYNCSRMRLDGYGGWGLIANRKGYLYINTSNFEVEEDGTIKFAGEFKEWSEIDERAEAEAA